jgi:ketosteroid isomerase-like protein
MKASPVLDPLPQFFGTEPVSRRVALGAGLLGVAAVGGLASTASAADAPPENPELENVKALLKAHDDAMSNQDLPGVLATMSEKASIMGTGPGEIWTGPDEIKTAYEHFFMGYDKGHQEMEYQFRIGGLGTDMGWLMASGNCKGIKDGKKVEFPLNLSLTVAKAGGEWKVASMHFSTFTGPGGVDAKGKKAKK